MDSMNDLSYKKVMIKLSFLYIIAVLLISSPAIAEVSFQYSGIAGVHLSDGKTSLFFDPVFSRPNIFEILAGNEFKIDNKMIHRELKKLNIQKLDAIFIGHTHPDHALDMHIIQKEVGGVIYGSRTTVNIALSLNIKKENTQIFSDDSKYQVGDFSIRVLKSKHGKIFGIYKFRDGEILTPLKRSLTLSDYVMGGSYSFYISHPEGGFLIHQSSRATKNVTKMIRGKKLKAVFQGIANRKSSKSLYDEIINIPKSVDLIVPIHHDNFLLDMNEKDMEYLWFVNVQDFLEESKRHSQKVLLPKYRKIYKL